jgi:hypothetical protein
MRKREMLIPFLIVVTGTGTPVTPEPSFWTFEPGRHWEERWQPPKEGK